MAYFPSPASNRFPHLSPWGSFTPRFRGVLYFTVSFAGACVFAGVTQTCLREVIWPDQISLLDAVVKSGAHGGIAHLLERFTETGAMVAIPAFFTFAAFDKKWHGPDSPASFSTIFAAVMGAGGYATSSLQDYSGMSSWEADLHAMQQPEPATPEQHVPEFQGPLMARLLISFYGRHANLKEQFQELRREAAQVEKERGTRAANDIFWKEAVDCVETSPIASRALLLLTGLLTLVQLHWLARR